VKPATRLDPSPLLAGLVLPEPPWESSTLSRARTGKPPAVMALVQSGAAGVCVDADLRAHRPERFSLRRPGAMITGRDSAGA